MITSFKAGSWPYYKVILACLLTGAFTLVISKNFTKPAAANQLTNAPACNPKMNLLRLKNHKLVQPLLFSDIDESDEKFSALKKQLNTEINTEKSNGKIQSVSIYLKELNDGSWMGINSYEQYDPGSIMKLPILLAYLKKAESQPAFFDKQLLFAGRSNAMPTQSIVSNKISPGKKYSITQLIHSMIVDSDNDANLLLNQSIEPDYVFHVFGDLGMEVPKIDQPTLKMSIIDLSKFLRVLYNSSYTTTALSEYALDLLTRTKFELGMKRGLPDNIVFAHKFGERGYQNSEIQELHETAIIYLENRPFLLTIMTKGIDQSKQAELIGNLTKTCFNWMSQSNIVGS